MLEGNTGIIGQTKDLSEYLLNSISYFRSKNGKEFLVCENRLFFGDYTGIFGSTEKHSSTDLVTKTILSKHNVKARILHLDAETVTDLEMNIIHEAFDTYFEQYIPMFNCKVRILKGRLSQILIAEFVFSTTQTYKLVLYSSSTSPSKKVR